MCNVNKYFVCNDTDGTQKIHFKKIDEKNKYVEKNNHNQNYKNNKFTVSSPKKIQHNKEQTNERNERKKYFLELKSGKGILKSPSTNEFNCDDYDVLSCNTFDNIKIF